jgi:uncharacterized repeat protein (TIGR01451 family)
MARITCHMHVVALLFVFPLQTKKSPPQSAPDVYIVKQTVAPKSQPVGSQFTFTIEVGVKGLSTAVARNVVLEDEVPAGLLLDSAQEITEPGEKGEGLHTHGC